MMNNPYRVSGYGYPMYNPAMSGYNAAPVAPVSPVSPAANAGAAVHGMSPGAAAAGVPATMGAPAQGGVQLPGQLPIEESFIENILRLNIGKVATIYMTFENNSQWNAKIFKGRIEAAGRDHIIISDPATGTRYLLLMVNLDYVTFDEELNYTYPIRPR